MGGSTETTLGLAAHLSPCSMSKEKLYCLSGTVSSELCEMLRALSCLSLFLTFNQNRIFSNLTLIHTFIPFFLSFLFFFFFFYKPVSGYQDLGGSISFCLGTDQWLLITVSNTAGHSWPCFFPTWQGLTFFFFFLK